MKVFLIRHGQTDWNLKGRIQGSCDTELNDTGIKQAEELSDKLLKGEYKFSKIYSSPKIRAVKTAGILSQAVNMDYITIKGLEEINFGEWEGLTWTEVKDRYPEEYAKWSMERRYRKPPKGESYQDMLERVLKEIHKIINDNCDNVVIVTHSAIIMCLQCCINNIPFYKMMKFKTENASIIEIDSDLLMSL